MEPRHMDDGLSSTTGQLYQTRTQELDLLLSFGNQVRTIQELKNYLHNLLMRSLTVVDCDRGDIMMLDEASNELEMFCAVGPHTGLIPERVHAEEGISARVLREKETQVVADVLTDPDYLRLLEKYPEETDYGLFLRSFVFTIKVPLLVGNNAIGILCAHSNEKRDISDKQVKLLESLVNRSAWAVHNVKTYGSVRRDLMRDIPSFLSSLGISELPIDIEDVTQIRRVLYRSCARKALELMGARSANIRLLDHETRRLQFAGTAGDGWSGEAVAKVYELGEDAAGPYTMRSRKTYKIDSIDEEQDIHYFPLFPWVKSHLSMPLMSRGRAIGVVSVDCDIPYAFAEDHVDSLAQLTKDIVKALEYVDLLENVNLHYLEEMAAQAKNVDEFCSRAVTEICGLISAEAGSIFILDPQEGDFVLRATTGLYPAINNGSRKSYSLGEGLTGWIAKHKKSLRLHDCGDKVRLIQISPDLEWKCKFSESIGDASKPYRYLGVPVLFGEKLLGVIRCVCRQNNAEFTEKEERLMNAVASCMAVNLDRIWLNQESEKLSLVQRQIEKTAANVAKLDGLLEVVLRSALDLVGCENGLIRLVDRRDSVLVLAAWQGIPSDKIPLTIPINDGIAGKALRTEEAQFADNTYNYRDFINCIEKLDDTPFREFVESIHSMIAIPLWAEGKVYGILEAYKNEVNGFCTKDLLVLQDIANYAAMPLHNAVHDQTTHLLSKMVEKFQDLLDHFSDEEELLSNVLDYAMELTGCEEGHILLLDPSHEWLETRVSKGMDKRLLERQKADIGVSGVALRDGKTLLVTNPHSNEDFKQFLDETLSPDKWELYKDLYELMVVPLISHSVRYGVICLHSINLVPNMVIKKSLMENLGNFAAGIIERSRLIDQESRIQQSKREQAEYVANIVRGMAHTVKTPLGLIANYLDRCAEVECSQQAPDNSNLPNIRAKVARVRCQVNQLLGATVPPRLSNFDFGAEIETLLHDTLGSNPAWQRDINSHVRYDDTLPKINADYNKLRIAFENVFINACEAMEETGGNLTMIINLGTDGGTIVAEIQDTGCGIPENDLQKVFRPLYSTKVNGTGLGLWITKQIIEIHHGTVFAKSNVGFGTIIHIELPVTQPSVTFVKPL